MVLKCCISTCRLQTDDPDSTGVSFHKLPAGEKWREEWMKILEKHCSSINLKYIYVCSQHFERECFQYTGLCRRRMLKTGSVPTVFFHSETVKCEKQDTDVFLNPVIQTHDNDCEKLSRMENDCQLNSENVKTELFGRNSQKSSLNLSDNILDFNNANGNYKTKTEKELRDTIEILRRKNKNLTARLARCRKKMYRYKFLFDTLRRRKFISDQNPTLQIHVIFDNATVQLLFTLWIRGPTQDFHLPFGDAGMLQNQTNMILKLKEALLNNS